jgi:hypothetical protein
MSGINRGKFIRNGIIAAAGTAVLPSGFRQRHRANTPLTEKITITNVGSGFEREPLIRPLGFKGGYVNELWQTASYLESNSGQHSIGLCTQSVLWSDPGVFISFSENEGNALMYALTERALQMLKGHSFYSPVELLDDIFPEIFNYGKKITSNKNLRKTFVLNSLVGIDNAAWILFARENKFLKFDEIIPEQYRPALGQRHKNIAAIPLFAYTVPAREIKEAANEGYFFMKIKIGQPGTQEEMLEKDIERLTEIHKMLCNYTTPYTSDKQMPYYFDANGRYESKETLFKLLDHAKKIGAFDRIALIEEPFPEELEIDVTDIPVRLASDETAHTARDAVARIEMGYRAVALKAIAKTMSMTMQIAQAAFERSVPCFCADLTVNPVLLEWNKNVAARLTSFPGTGDLGLLESNGNQNYKNWATMTGYNPNNNAKWATTRNGLYELDDEYFEKAGGIFDPVPHYEAMFDKSVK